MNGYRHQLMWWHMQVGDLVYVKTHPDMIMALIVRIRHSAEDSAGETRLIYECRALDGHSFSCLGENLEVINES